MSNYDWRFQPAGPYHLLGWSFGAVAAHAMAARLQQQGHTVTYLGLLDDFRRGLNQATPSTSMTAGISCANRFTRLGCKKSVSVATGSLTRSSTLQSTTRV
ncbi:thioesterase domain-containing protein [Caballeronia sp. 15711]|uniref:thioesterase domain-containing protein n=1 Tax=Caballeronia sp. 15711 TaxID=3391029 RepID=UPI0039E3EB73